MQVGYIGLGNMGAPLARRLLGQGNLIVHDLNRTAVAGLRDAGAVGADTAADLARRCDVVVLCLPTTDDVVDLIFGADGIAAAARPGTLFVDQTTGDPVKMREMAPKLAQLGLEIIDAPVSGGPEGAVAGTIAILVGGTKGQYNRVTPVLEHISPNHMHVGAFGAGYVAKLANNLLFAAQRLMTLEVVAMAAKNGLAPEVAVDVLMAGSARNFFLDHTMKPRILTGKLTSGFTLGLSHKDVRLATELAGASGVPMPLGNQVREIYAEGIAEFGAEAQVNVMALLMDRLAGTSVVPPLPEPEPNT